MRPWIEWGAVLFVMLVVLRVSLARPRGSLRLRGGLVALNICSGALAGCVAAKALRFTPFLGLAIGGLLGYLIFGALWRRLLLNGPAAARAWLRWLQFALCGVAAGLLIGRFLG
ncbi:MAG TPA: hypothetical protein VFB95_06480 [Candidatus Cryosericum sp.]|nr:hypothetical protein [Candidatus Cryosericum sp.]